MNHIERNRVVHESSQLHIKIASNSLTNHLHRIDADYATKNMVGSMLEALQDKNELVTALYEEIDKIKELAK